MSRILMGSSLVVVLSVGWTVEEDPQKVVVTLVDGTTTTGEILALRDSAIVFAAPAGLDQAELQAGFARIWVLEFTRIDSISTPEETHSETGFLAGLVLGAAGGYAIGSSQPVAQQKNDIFGCEAISEHAAKSLFGAVIGGCVGCFAGGLIGGNVRTGGVTLITPTKRNFQPVRSLARYPAAEPEYLRKIAP